jgi:lipid-binding SYLF domain-containing protein
VLDIVSNFVKFLIQGIFMNNKILQLISALVGVLLLTGCSTAPKTIENQQELTSQAQSAIGLAKSTDPGLQRFFDTAAGYAVFPSVGKGAIGVGGAYGRGQLFEDGKLVGYCSLTQASIGFQLGGQKYTELIFFETKSAVDSFKIGNYDFSAQVSAVALKSGVSANAKYADSVAVFTMGEEGLMYEASVGGQKFSFEPLGLQ